MKYIFSSNKHTTAEKQYLNVCTVTFPCNTNDIYIIYIRRYYALPVHHFHYTDYPIPNLCSLLKVQSIRLLMHSHPHRPEEFPVLPFKEQLHISHHLLISFNCNGPNTRSDTHPYIIFYTWPVIPFVQVYFTCGKRKNPLDYLKCFSHGACRNIRAEI